MPNGWKKNAWRQSELHGMSKKAAMRAVGISRRKQGHGSSSRKTQCSNRVSCRAQSRSEQADDVREMRSALKHTIGFHDSPIRWTTPPRVTAPPRRQRLAARVAPAVTAVVAVQPQLVVAPPPAVAVLSGPAEGEAPPADAPVVFRASKPASTFAVPRWAHCTSGPGCPKC